MTLASCSPAPLPAAPPLVDVGMDEYRFVLKSPLRSGRNIFRTSNLGMINHELILVTLPQDMEGTLDQQLRGTSRRSVSPVRVIQALPPGDKTAFAVDLKKGRYGLLCFLKEEPEGESHALKGMNADFRVS